MVIMGDFNYPDIDWKDESCNKKMNHKATKFLSCLQQHYLYQIIDTPTHYRGTQTPALIDLIITNDDDLVTDLS